MPKGGLGKGLGALLPGDIEDKEQAAIPIKAIKARSDQPRKRFDDEAMNELAQSIKEHGVLQPVLVRDIGDGYELIAGERRLRAAEAVGLTEIPAIVKNISDAEAAEIALIENLQREDLTPLEEARAYRDMIDKFGYTQEQIAERIGRSRSYVTNMIRLLGLPEEILEMLEKGMLTPGHARVLISLPLDSEEKTRLARMAVKNGYNVRKMEELARQAGRKKKTKTKSAEYIFIEERLEEKLGTKTKITPKKKGGKIEINYYSYEDLERILELLDIEL